MAETDWNAIERDWRDGALSIRAIATSREVPESTIRGQAKARGWPPREPSRNSPLGEAAPDDALRIASRQRRDIARLARLQDDLAAKARILVEAAGSVKELADAAAAVERLGRITERLIALERQAFALDDKDAAGGAAFAELLRKARERAEGGHRLETKTISDGGQDGC